MGFFKSIFNVVKKIAAPVLAVAAVVYTAGAALNVVLPGMAAGAATAAGGGLMGALSAGATGLSSVLSGTLGSVLGGALTYAGYGAAAGGLMAAIKGGDITESMTKGMIMGGLTGGAMSAFAPGVLPGAGVASSGLTTSGTGAVGAGGITGGQGLSLSGVDALAGAGGPAVTNFTGTALATPVGSAITTAAPSSTGLLATLPATATPAQGATEGGLLGFMNKNPALTQIGGEVLKGAFSPKQPNQLDVNKQEQEYRSGLYGGAYTGREGILATGGGVPLASKEGPTSVQNTAGMYRYNNVTKEVEWTPLGAPVLNMARKADNNNLLAYA